MKLLIFSTYEIKYIWYLPKKSKFSFYFFRKGGKINFFYCHFSLILLGSARLVGVILGATENGILCHLNEWIKRNLRFKKAAGSCHRIDVACKLSLRKLKMASFTLFDVRTSVG